MLKWIALTVASAALIAPSASFAQGAAGDQYTEQIPNAGGDTSSGGAGDTSGGGDGRGGNGVPDTSRAGNGSSGADTPTSGGSTISPSSGSGTLNSDTVKDFNKDPDGGAAANLAQKTAPDSDALNQAALQAQAGTDDGASTEAFGSTTAEESNSGVGMGLILLIVLAVIAAAGFAYKVWRRSRGDPRRGEGSPTTA